MSRSACLALVLLALPAAGADRPRIDDAVVGDDGAAPEISTQELRDVLFRKAAWVFDTRPAAEYAMGHIPGTLNVAPKPGVPMSAYVSDVAEIARVVGGNRQAAIVLACNGPFCGKSRRLADELRAEGFTDVRRYQLGLPVWKALGGTCVIEPAGLGRVVAGDRTAVIVDVRERDAFRAGSLPGARNIPRSGVVEARDTGEVKRAKDDGRLPMDDHGTRIVVVGADAESARAVAQALAREAFWNVSYFPGTFEEAREAARRFAARPRTARSTRGRR